MDHQKEPPSKNDGCLAALISMLLLFALMLAVLAAVIFTVHWAWQAGG